MSLGVNSVAGGGTGSTSFTTGSVPFSNGTILTQDNSKLFWDNTNFDLGIGTATPAANLQVNMTAIGNVGETINGIASQTADYFDIFNTTPAIVFNVTKGGLVGINKLSPAAMMEIDSSAVNQPNMILKEIASQTVDVLEIENSSNTKLVDVSAAGYVGIATAVATTGISFNYLMPVAASSASKGLNIIQTAFVFPATSTVENISLTSDTAAYAAGGTAYIHNDSMTVSKPATGNTVSNFAYGINETIVGNAAINTASTAQTYNEIAGSFLVSPTNTVSGSSTSETLNNTGMRATVLDELQHTSSGTNTEVNIGVDASVGNFLASVSAGTLNRTDYGVRVNIAAVPGAHVAPVGYAVWANSGGTAAYTTGYDFYAASTNPSYFTGPVKLLHTVGNSGSTTLTAGAGAGTAPTVLASGNDLSGTLIVITGTLPTAAAVIGTLTYSIAYGGNTNVQLTPGNASAALLSGVTGVFATGSTTNFTFTSGPTGLTAATTYLWYYQVSQ